ncbi:CHASE2 domain-containing protein [Marinagarivorans cellulosilyticus]|uniref:Adenylate cyclase n=1 Tax=Marinagarivorans cellulosilyticus TaxID=2721545 RepID=A0AAN2BJ53_9GAMM|nr:adenylate/guanylate cyclase domain-containing protein [Marinagarivorans cellulosilyticus]BCD96660.1 adenylate cyclase [Marinagarivorans cellulosilyticus]
MTYLATNSQQITPKNTSRYFCLLLAVASIALFSLTPLAGHIEKRTSLPALFYWRGPIPAPNDVIIVGLNSSAAERMGLSRHSHNWPRTLYAQLLNKLTKANAKIVVFDVAFKAPRSEEEDSQLEAAIANNAKVLLYTYLKRHQVALANGLVDIEQPVPPLPRFAQHALAVGHFTLPKAAHNITHTSLFEELGAGPQPSQPLLAALALIPPQPLESKSTLNERAQQLYQHTLKTVPPTSRLPHKTNKRLVELIARKTPMIINYFGGAQTFQQMDIDKALALSPADFAQAYQDKTVYIGYLETHQTEQQDAYSTVYTSDTGVDISGVEISATVFSNIIQGNDIRTLPRWAGAIIGLLFCVIGFGIIYKRLMFHLIIQGLTVSIYLIACYYTFSLQHYALPITVPLLALFLGNLLQLQRQFYFNRKRLNHIRYALTQYLPQEAANALSKNINTLEKQHTLVHGVVLMTDIKGYTTLSETLPPVELHRLMNGYYKELIGAVQNNGGTIGNIVGDSLMAMWTGPKIDTAMCQQAMQAVLDIQQAITNTPAFASQLPTCSALHGGQFSLGNLGAQGHFEYSPVGDIINTVSRIEHFNRELGTEFLFSQAIAEQLTTASTPHIKLKLGEFALRNKSEKTSLYTLINDTQNKELTQQDMQHLSIALTKIELGDYIGANNNLKLIQLPALAGVCEFYARQYQQPKTQPD